MKIINQEANGRKKNFTTLSQFDPFILQYTCQSIQGKILNLQLPVMYHWCMNVGASGYLDMCYT